jgi:hypothetical protein
MSYIGKTPTSVPLTSSDITDGIISLPKLTDGTDGNLISYDASGNPVAVATGTDGQVLTSAGAGAPPVFETLPTNTPAFSAKRTSTQAIANNTMTTVLFDTEVFDSDGKYDPSTGKFTPTVVGKYFVQTNLILGGLADNDYLYWLLKKNGSTFSYGQIFSGGSNAEIGSTISGTIDLDADDDVRVDVYQGSGSSKNLPSDGCVFSAYKIIE